MARNDGRSNGDDELMPRASARADAPSRAARVADPIVDEDEEVDPRLLDLDAEEESPFLRAPRRVSVRRSALPRKAADRIRIATIALVCAGILGIAAFYIYSYGTHSWRFVLESSDDVEIAGMRHVTRAQVMDVFGADLGRNVFFVPLAERKRQLEQIPWVESATVMRLLPHRLSITVRERTPLAFAQVGPLIELIDANGVLMELPPGGRQYSFPVLVGMSETEPLSTRAARMRLFVRLFKELDGDGARNSQDISEVDLRDPDDARITYADAHGTVLVHLGDGDFLNRYRIFKSHLAEWRQQFQKLDSVDLRYERQVIVNADAKAANQPQSGAPVNSRQGTAGTAPVSASRKPQLGATVPGSATPRRK